MSAPDAGRVSVGGPGVVGHMSPRSGDAAFGTAVATRSRVDGGRVVCGATWAGARVATSTDPSANDFVAPMHLGVLATLTTGMSGFGHLDRPPCRTVLIIEANLWWIPIRMVECHCPGPQSQGVTHSQPAPPVGATGDRSGVCSGDPATVKYPHFLAGS